MDMTGLLGGGRIGFSDLAEVSTTTSNVAFHTTAAISQMPSPTALLQV